MPRGLANDSLPFPSPPEDITRGFLAAGAISGSGLEPLEPCFSVVDFECSSCRDVLLMAVTLGKVVRSVVLKSLKYMGTPIDAQFLQVIKTFSMREGWWYIGIKGGGGVKSKGTRIVIEKEKRNRPILAACRHV